MPDHPLLENLDDMSIRELAHVSSVLFFPRAKQQMNRQLSEMVIIEITVDADAAPGKRELRLGTSTSLTNPMVFQVGVIPEVRELEPNDRKAYPTLPNMPKLVSLPSDKPLETPVLLNGQIMPGDVDRFRFRARKGQRLVIETHARRLVPFLADAVPGWFQATVALVDAKGREVAFADDYRFSPDPVLLYKVPASGEYELEIRDAIYRGREDFVYRIAIGELPFITQMFPLGGRAGIRTVAAIDGWNLPRKRLLLDTKPSDHRIRQAALLHDQCRSNTMTYAVDTLPESNEIEPNDNRKSAQHIDLPVIVNGRIGRPGDTDVFQFEGHEGDQVVADVQARRLHSPLDSLLRLTDASGRVVAWNDDHVLKDGHLHKDMGYLTHHADSYLSARLPANGVYYVQIADAQHHGSEAHGYRLRISPPQADFSLHVSPSTLSVPAGRLALLTVHALRKDGFNGDIALVLEGAPAGFALSGGRIPSGCDRVRMTLTAPPKALGQPVALRLVGRAQIDGKVISRAATPADDVMQAFLYRHLAPRREFAIAVTKAKWNPLPAKLAGRGPVRVPAGGTVLVRLKTPRRVGRRVTLKLSEAPKGITIGNAKVLADGVTFQLKAEGKAVRVGFADNLIVEASVAIVVKGKGKGKAKAAAQTRWSSAGTLPAIPFVVVQP